MTPIVEVHNLYKSFTRGDERIDVLMDLNLDVREGEFVTLMGPSGSGKTTLLNLIAGLDTPTEGTIRVGEQEISAMSESELARWRTRNVGFVFQFYNLLPVLTAYENVELPLLLLPLSKPQRRRQVENALGLVGLSDRMGHRPGQLSGGEQQRVAVARALVNRPLLVLADEPSGNLDRSASLALQDLIFDLARNQGETFVIVTHDEKLAARADRVMVLEDGALRRRGPETARMAVPDEEV